MKSPSFTIFITTAFLLVATIIYYFGTNQNNIDHINERSRRRLKIDDDGSSGCDSIQPVDQFDVDDFISKPWFSVKERAMQQFSDDYYDDGWGNYGCVEARYYLESKRWWHRWIMGWTISVNNYASSYRNGEFDEAEVYLCAKILKDDMFLSKLVVGPCFIPSFLLTLFSPEGNYWVVVYNETVGHAVISGGPPSIDVGDGTCINDVNKGLWIFNREQNATLSQINATVQAAKAVGFNIDTLTDFYFVDHGNCSRAEEFGWPFSSVAHLT